MGPTAVRPATSRSGYTAAPVRSASAGGVRGLATHIELRPRPYCGAGREMETDHEVRFVGGGDVVGVKRECCLGIRLRGWSTTHTARHRRATSVARMRLRCHEAVGSKWLSIVRLSEHVSEPIRRARRLTSPQASRPSVIRPKFVASLEAAAWAASAATVPTSSHIGRDIPSLIIEAPALGFFPSHSVRSGNSSRGGWELCERSQSNRRLVGSQPLGLTRTTTSVNHVCECLSVPIGREPGSLAVRDLVPAFSKIKPLKRRANIGFVLPNLPPLSAQSQVAQPINCAVTS
jgi:hypothetical protein